jgi:hypothetical protein
MSLVYGPNVRVVCKPAAPPSSDLVVQVRDKRTGWREIGRFNDMSDDFAHAHAQERALSARRSLLEGEQP